jgi:hypothetical protein
LELPSMKSRVFGIGGVDPVSYGGLMSEYAHQRGLRRFVLPVPVLTPRLSSPWLGLAAPLYVRVGRKRRMKSRLCCSSICLRLRAAWHAADSPWARGRAKARHAVSPPRRTSLCHISRRSWLDDQLPSCHQADRFMEKRGRVRGYGSAPPPLWIAEHSVCHIESNSKITGNEFTCFLLSWSSWDRGCPRCWRTAA